jgi:CMP-N,N'-diacetyllegionaminic acid synthase
VNKAVCIIPARGGSKRVPRKNVLPLNGIPLLSYTIRAAIASGLFDKIVLSSDDDEMVALGKSEGVDIDIRPAYLAGDTATNVQVVKEFIERTNAINHFETITSLHPTCPFRTSAQLKEAFEIFTTNKHKIPFLIGVTEYDFPIQLALSPWDDITMQMTFEDGYNVTRSQNIEKRYHPNGAMYMATIEAFIENGTFFKDQMLTYKMDAISSYDIDYPWQFEVAEILAKKYNKQ